MYLLSANKDACIHELGRWENGEWIWELSWRRELFEREKVGANDLLSSIAVTNLTADSADGWCWNAENEGTYSTRSAYTINKEISKDTTPADESFITSAKVWKIPIPHKVRITAWRILRNRLPTCANLRRRHIEINEVELGCNMCFHHEESVNHLFLHCPKTGKVWEDIHKWLGISFVRPQNVAAHFSQFIEWYKRKESRKFLGTVWSCTNWVLWRCRNFCHFDGKAWETNDIFLEIKGRIWS
ncbi:uncharacterized protein LOC131025747 [Salvia miltiorrhiza]|uniref:uncharacterized protein LOC131025747 n=1 Tax=Salvia miltiorrhiza TaxID=226208 RepID=UPI0025ACE121|nr:uncharacterized protein LOC131025747 [Salvia miltiorrhiza]